MKKFYTLFVFSLLFLVSFAKHVDVSKAELIAKNLYFERVNETHAFPYQEIDPELYFTKQSEMTDLYYIFNISGKVEGYIIVSADDAAFPVIGYSFEGNYKTEEESPALKNMLIIYEKQLSSIINDKMAADFNTSSEWSRLSTMPIFRGYRSVSPLVSTKWGQGKYYNKSCPYDASSSEDSRVLVGCVAIAMGQVMRYHQSPTTGTGSSSYYHSTYGTQSASYGMTTYNWSSMPYTLTAHNSSIATLLYHCGVSVEMNYGVSGSGAYTSDAATSLVNYFGYSSTTSHKDKGNYTNTAWEALLKTEIDNSRPIIYHGYGSSGGHAFVCDGYQGTSNNYFHFNWGWYGYLDGYFYVSSLNPGTMDFTNNQGAVIGIKPVTTSNVKLSLYSAMSATPATLVQYDKATIWVQLYNSGTVDFTGDYRVSIYSTSGQFVEQIDTYNNISLKSGYYYTNGIDFIKNSISANPGNYQIVAEFRPSGGYWTLVDKSTFSNPMSIVIKAAYSSYDLRMYKAFVITPDPIVQNDSCEVWFDLANYSSNTFNGDITVSLFDATSGQFVETIETIDSLSLNAMSHYTYGLYFKSMQVLASPGDYLIAAHFRPTGGSWSLLPEGNYYNPVSITISNPALKADPYEVNNTESTPYTFNLTWKGDSAVVQTTNSNIHVSKDFDYYKFVLSSGYKYTISSRLHDASNSGDGNTYTIDAVFAYKSGSNWSAYFDDKEANNYDVIDGGTVLYEVSPYFEGVTGTYLLDVHIKRSIIGDPDLIVINQNVNPTTVIAGDKVTATCDVKNSGSSPSGSSILKYYLSANTTYESGDIELASDNIISLSKDGSVTAGKELTIPISTIAGVFYILFYADAISNITESNELNNVSYKQIIVQSAKPDLIISVKNITPSTLKKGETMSASCTIKNQGQGEAAASMVKYYLSQNTTYEVSDIELGSDNLMSINKNGTGSANENLIIPLTVIAGNWFILFRADASEIIDEEDENNNVDYLPIVINSNSGINEEGTQSRIIVYPNPGNGLFNCKIDNLNGKAFDYYVSDISGKIILEGKTDVSEFSVDIQKFGSGIYNLIIRDQDQISRNILIVQ